MNLGYTGKPYDTATGMYNYGDRDYVPEVARFTTVDPIRDGSNWFAYVNNDPVNWVDPWGLECSHPSDKENATENKPNTPSINLTVEQIGNIVFNETRSLSGEGIQKAQENIAHSVINASEKWGDNRSKYAGTAPSTVTEQAKTADSKQYESAQAAAKTAVETHLTNDPTNGATNLNFRTDDDRSNFWGTLEIQTQVGPLDNSYPTQELPATGIYANTYK
jgi:RHS repeat-associated protein